MCRTDGVLPQPSELYYSLGCKHFAERNMNARPSVPGNHLMVLSKTLIMHSMSNSTQNPKGENEGKHTAYKMHTIDSIN